MTKTVRLSDGATMYVAGQTEERNPNVLIAIPSARDVSHQWASRLVEIVIAGSREAAIQFRFFPSYGVDMARDIAAETAMRGGFSHVLFIDNDTFAPPDVVGRLLGHRKQIVGALYRERHPPFYFSLGRRDPRKPGQFYDVPKDWKFGDLIEVDFVGFGCVLVDVDVFRRLRRPWFLSTGGRVFDLPDGQIGGSRKGGVGEDMFFCLEAKKSGIPTFVDTGTFCSHQTTVWIGAESREPTFSFPPPPWTLPWPEEGKDPKEES